MRGTPTVDDRVAREAIPDDARARDRWIRGVLVDAVTRACPSWLVSEREDIVHDAMTRLAVALRDAELTAPRAYVAKAAYHAVVDAIRRSRRRRELAALDPEVAVDERASAEAQAERGRVATAVRACLERTVPNRRAAVLLYLEGRGPGEVATMLGSSRKQADNAIHRGLADLRACLRSKGVEP